MSSAQSRKIVREIMKGAVAEMAGKLLLNLKKGDRVRSSDGRVIQITDGQFYGTYGISNFWYWREVLPTGELAETVEHGYGFFTEV